MRVKKERKKENRERHAGGDGMVGKKGKAASAGKEKKNRPKSSFCYGGGTRKQRGHARPPSAPHTKKRKGKQGEKGGNTEGK
jgi:hypothetical protein